MKLHLNGDVVEVPDAVSTVDELKEHFELQNRVVIVELNGTILEKTDHPETRVEDGDRIEIVQFVGGG